MATRNGHGVAAGEAKSDHGDAALIAPSDHSDPRRALLLSVLHQALNDCRNPTARSSGASSAMPDDRREAFRFLLDERGPRARWRRQICELAGVDPDHFEESVRLEAPAWPPLDEFACTDRRQQYSSRHRSSENRRGDVERRREQSRECMRAKRQRERQEMAHHQDELNSTRTAPQSYRQRALAVGTSLTFPTFPDR
jgi:hypothetical protein